MAGSNTLQGKFDIEVAGKKYSCHLNMNAFRLLCESENIALHELQKYMNEKPLTAVPKVLYFSVVNECHYRGKEVRGIPKFEQLAAHVVHDQETLQKYTELIGKAFGGEEDTPEEEGND